MTDFRGFERERPIFGVEIVLNFPLLGVFVLNTGRTAQAKAFAPLFVLTAFFVRRAVLALFIITP
jgi:hypothetical protein